MKRLLCAVLGSLILTSPVRAIDLSSWNQLLAGLVDSHGQVDYALWKAQHLPKLDAFMGDLARENANAYTVPAEKLAFWINAYNAAVIRGVLRRYPMKSVMDFPEFFHERVYTIAGMQLSLDDIENRMIRPVFKDARVHFALVCGARSCPRLLDRAYTGAGLDDMLDARGREFLMDSSKNRFEPAAVRASVSSIFQWFAGDFVAAAGSIPKFLRRFAPTVAQGLLASPSLKLGYLSYDWSLNDRPAAGGSHSSR